MSGIHPKLYVNYVCQYCLWYVMGMWNWVTLDVSKTMQMTWQWWLIAGMTHECHAGVTVEAVLQ